ncbi:MAG: hypothetical protein HY235_06840 [Acidobacteria bacterium]|nr:hypothetical protein [Acidobacteriota bacterium]
MPLSAEWEVEISCLSLDGGEQRAKARVVNSSEGGICIACSVLLEGAGEIKIRGLVPGLGGEWDQWRRAQVVWSRYQGQGVYQAGLYVKPEPVRAKLHSDSRLAATLAS